MGLRSTILALAAILCLTVSGAAQAGTPRPVWITLGTGGGPVIRVNRHESSNALVIGHDIYLFDVGNGVLYQMAKAKLNLGNVKAIFISHHHIDHNADIGVVLIERWQWNMYKPIPVIGACGTVSLIRNVLKGYHVTELAPITEGGPPSPSIASTVAARDIPADTSKPVVVYQDKNIKVSAITNTHYHYPPGSAEQKFSHSYSFRIETLDRTIVFTGDTGPSRRVEMLAKGADLLVSEVIDLHRMITKLRKAHFPQKLLTAKIRHMREDHLTPTEAAKLAAKAGVKELVLTHLVPGDDGETDLSGYTKGISAYFKGSVHLANDLDRF